MVLSLLRLVVLTFFVSGVASQNLPDWCSATTSSMGAITVRKGDGCASVVTDDEAHCIFTPAQDGSCQVKSGDQASGSDAVGLDCCIITTGNTKVIHDNGVCGNLCSTTETTDTTPAATNAATTVETSGSWGRGFVASTAAVSSTVVAFFMTI